jgi:hypothetical protein
MKKSAERNFVVGTHDGGILSLAPIGRTSIGCKIEQAPIEAVYAWMARRRRKENPSSPRSKRARRRLLTSSEQMKGWKND